jgi:hypothetical protein
VGVLTSKGLLSNSTPSPGNTGAEFIRQSAGATRWKWDRKTTGDMGFTYNGEDVIVPIKDGEIEVPKKYRGEMRFEELLRVNGFIPMAEEPEEQGLVLRDGPYILHHPDEDITTEVKIKVGGKLQTVKVESGEAKVKDPAVAEALHKKGWTGDIYDHP